MDFLADIKTPDASHLTKYVVGPPWDCKPFLTFAARHGYLSRVPLVVRRPVQDLHIPYTELLYPSPTEESEGFYLSWCYFGLAAELLGLNEGPNRRDDLSQEQAELEFATLKQELVMEHGGCWFLNGAKIMEKLGPRLRYLMTATDVRLECMLHLRECLHFVRGMIDNIFDDNFDDWVIMSVAGLGEIISTALVICGKRNPIHDVISDSETSYKVDPNAYIWTNKVAKSQKLRNSMLEAGWCPSEIERALTMHSGLATICSLSQLNMQAVRRDHSACSHIACKAFQIDLRTYELSHAVAGCSCHEYAVDISKIERVLLETSTFPILRFMQGDDDTITVAVEEYEPGCQFVALSHVWADGLGNPRENAIQQCQLARLRELVPQLKDVTTPLGESKCYRLWIDTLCCPVDPYTKWLALQRIAEVYASATHVLVLDSSLSNYSSQTTPAETLLRIFGTSSWMRRLWTLQEGALSKSLCFQFSDRAVRDWDLVLQLRKEAKLDVRLYIILRDIEKDLYRVHTFLGVQDDSYHEHFVNYLEPRLAEMQEALYFRTVTVPSDEPICLATLLSLDIGRIAALETHEDRMALVWQELANRHGGIPPRIIFTEDHPLQKPGFRWAPMSLLGLSTKSFYNSFIKAARFSMTGMKSSSAGVLTEHGLRVVFPGYKVRVRPLIPDLPLHPWKGVVKDREDMLYARNESSGQWLRIMDSEHVFSEKSPEEEQKWFQEIGYRLCESMHEGEAALINDVHAFDMPTVATRNASHMGLLVHIAPGLHDEPHRLRTRSFRPLMINPLSSATLIVVEGVRHLAMRLAGLEVTRRCASATNRDEASEAWIALRTEMREAMQSVAAEYWDATPEFAEAVGESVGPDYRDWVWILIPKLFSHEILLDSLPEDQVWVVD